MARIAANCYLPANALLLKLIKKNPAIKVAFSISGVAIDQMEAYAPEVLDSFQALAETGSVEFLTETYYHSLVSMTSGNEFEIQVSKHQQKIRKHFKSESQVFRNTELIYSDSIGARVKQLGFKAVMIDGIDGFQKNRNVHGIFDHAGNDGIKLLLRDYRLSDEIAFRFAQFAEPLTAKRYISLLEALPPDENVINLGLDYETFGEHHKKETGIFSFLESLLTRLSGNEHFRFVTPSDAVEEAPAAPALPIPGCISWADKEKDVSAWLGNEMQRDAFDSLMSLERLVKNRCNKTLLQEWRNLQSSDHFYYMSTKHGGDGEVHSYFSPYASPYEAFINFMNVLADLEMRINADKADTPSEYEETDLQNHKGFETLLSVKKGIPGEVFLNEAAVRAAQE